MEEQTRELTNPEKQLGQQILSKTRELIKRDGKIFSEKPPIKVTPYDVDPSTFFPKDPNIKLRLLGPTQRIRLLLFEREEDKSISIQVHAQYPHEIQVISLDLSERQSPKLSEYKVIYSSRDKNAPPLYTTPTPIPEVTLNTLQTFDDLLNQAKLEK